MDYLNEVRCNGVVKWKPDVITDQGIPKVKFTIVVSKKLKIPRRLDDGRLIEFAHTYWKCNLRAYTDRLPLFEAAQRLIVGQEVFVRGEFYYTKYRNTKGTLTDYYGLIVHELDIPHTILEDCRVQSLVKTTIKSTKDRLKSVQISDHGEKTITDGALGKSRFIKDEEVQNNDSAQDEDESY